MIDVAIGASALNYRIREVHRIAQLGTNKVTGEVEKVKTTSGQVWAVADLEPQGSIIEPLDQQSLDFCLSLIRECCLSGIQDNSLSVQDLGLMRCLTEGQKRQVWEQLATDEKQQIRKLKEGSNK